MIPGQNPRMPGVAAGGERGRRWSRVRLCKRQEVEIAMIHEVELVLGLLVAVAALVTLASRFDLPYPILLVLGGLVLGVIPGLPRVTLEPDLVFLIFLPPLLYRAAIT